MTFSYVLHISLRNRKLEINPLSTCGVNVCHVMEVFITTVCIGALVLLGVLLLLGRSLVPQSRQKTVLLFIDAPDPDNAAAGTAVWKYILKKRGHLHIVLTGRPVDLSTEKKFKDGVPIMQQIVRQKWERSVQKHAERLLEDSACRITNYLLRCNVPLDRFTIYHGLIASDAPMSDVAHDWDFLFDRKDLITGKAEDEGEILDPADYKSLVSKYNNLNLEEREQMFLSILRHFRLASLETLQAHIKSYSCSDISIFLGGPATAVVKLFKGDPSLREKVTEFYGMFGSLNSPGGKQQTLFVNQFNVACDLTAASDLFLQDVFPHVNKYLITTETAKLTVLVPSAQELEERRINSYVVKLQRLWESTHQGAPQPLFDVLPVMAALPEFRNDFTWVGKKAVVWDLCKSNIVTQIFCFADSDSSSLLVSEGRYNSDRETFMRFLSGVWK